MSNQEPIATVSVSDMFCDRLVFTIDYQKPADQLQVVKTMQEFCSQKMQVKQHFGLRYKHRVFVYQGAYPSTMQMLIEYLPKVSGLSFFRIDFNPAHCDMDMVKALLLNVLPGGLADLPLKAKVTRIDLTVDVEGVHIDCLLAAYPGMQVSRIYCKSGKTETMYLGCYEGAKLAVLYDKVQQVKRRNAKMHLNTALPPDPTTRVELRLRPDMDLLQLTELDNPFQKLIISSWPMVKGQEDQIWKLFIAVAQSRGLHDALLMIKDKNERKKYRDRIVTAAPAWWLPHKVWEIWPKVLADVFMLNGYGTTPV